MGGEGWVGCGWVGWVWVGRVSRVCEVVGGSDGWAGGGLGGGVVGRVGGGGADGRLEGWARANVRLLRRPHGLHGVPHSGIRCAPLARFKTKG